MIIRKKQASSSNPELIITYTKIKTNQPGDLIQVQIRLHLAHQKGIRKDYSSGVYFPANEWNSKIVNFPAKWPSEFKEEYNTLFEKTHEIKTTFYYLRREETPNLLYTLHCSLKGNNREGPTLLSFFHKLVKEQKETYLQKKARGIKASNSQYKHWKSTFHQLAYFLEYRNNNRKKPSTLKYSWENDEGEHCEAPDLRCHQIKKSLLINFDQFIRENSKYLCNDSGASKHHQKIKSAVQKLISQHRDLLLENPYDHFKICRPQNTGDHIRPENLQLLERETNTDNHRNNESTLFCYLFCCYTGLAFVDASQLTYQSIQKDGNDLWIDGKRAKSKERFRLKLNQKAIFYLNKYRMQQKLTRNPENDQLIFSHLTTVQCANRHLKTIQKNYEIEQVLTFHMARHTFGYLLNEAGVETSIIMRQMGHKDIRSSLIYTKWASDKKLSQAQEKANQFLDSSEAELIKPDGGTHSCGKLRELSTTPEEKNKELKITYLKLAKP